MPTKVNSLRLTPLLLIALDSASALLEIGLSVPCGEKRGW